jgi:hypothetical protein
MKYNLFRLSLFALVCLVSVSTAMAYVACPTTTLANGTPAPAYENTDGSTNGYDCQIGNLLFSNFHSSTPTVSPTLVGVQPGFQPGTTPPNTNPGFEFNGPFSGLEDVNVEFTVTALTGTITDVFIDLVNSHVSGTGEVSYTETVCPSNSGCTLYTDNPGTSTTTDEITLSPGATSININKDLELLPGSSGTASMSAFSNYYSTTVPEPREVSILLGLGFFGIMAFMKRRQGVRS